MTRKTFRSEVYCPSYRDVRFMVCPSYRDSTVVSQDRIFDLQIELLSRNRITLSRPNIRSADWITPRDRISDLRIELLSRDQKFEWWSSFQKECRYLKNQIAADYMEIFIPGWDQLGIPSWKNCNYMNEKFHPGLKIFQPGLKCNGLE